MSFVKCPKCGMTQMARETCRACGKALGAAPPPIARSVSETRPAPAPVVASPAAAPVAARADGPLDPAFDRDRFLLKQPLISINSKYEVWDEAGTPILFIERPAHLGRNLLAMLAGLAAGAVVFAGAIAITALLEGSDLGMLISVLGLFAAALVAVVVGVTLSQKRHVTFYRDATRAEKLLSVRQDQKFTLLVQTFTIQDAQGGVLGIARKNWLSDVLRKKWRVLDPEGRPLFEAREDLVHALLSRLVAKLFPMNFHFHAPGLPEELGSFNRKFTIRDRYVLDLAQDRNRLIDRRLGLALGVLLDTGERR